MANGKNSSNAGRSQGENFVRTVYFAVGVTKEGKEVITSEVYMDKDNAVLDLHDAGVFDYSIRVFEVSYDIPLNQSDDYEIVRAEIK